MLQRGATQTTAGPTGTRTARSAAPERQTDRKYCSRRRNDAVRFFKENAEYLQNIRNDFGGHFSRSAATHAVKAIDPGIIGSIEISFKDGKANPKAFFVDALVDEAMLKRRGDRTREDYAAEMIAFAMTGFNHASSCLHVLLLHYLIPRFGRG